MTFRPAALVVILFVALGASVPPGQKPGTAFETEAGRAFMVESATGTTLIAKEADRPMAPASLAKLMTVELVFQALAKGEVTLDTEYAVSEHAWRTGGAPSRTSTMFAAIKSRIRVEDLITGVAVQMANDGCIVLAEGLAGSETAFVGRMNARARELGLAATRFGNATGLPEQPGTTTLRDMVTLARHIIATYPQYYPLYRQADFEWNKIYQRNKNPLLGSDLGVDGLVSGFSEADGYSMVAAAEKDGVRLVLGIGGLESEKDRAEETARVLGWGQTAFVNRLLYKAGEVIGAVSTYGGARGALDVVARDPVAVYVPAVSAERLSGRIVYRWPLRAPVEKGAAVATLRLFSGEALLREVPLVAAAAVARGSLPQRAVDAVLSLAFFWL